MSAHPNAPRLSLPDLQRLFETLPGLYLILTADLTIVAASDAYLRATFTQRDTIMGKGLFDVFPDNPHDPHATGVRNLTASLARVIRHKRPDTMNIQKYDIQTPSGQGAFEERYWSPSNTPVLNDEGDILYIIHRVEDVTEFMQLQQQRLQQSKENDALRTRTDEMESTLYSQMQEIALVNGKLETANKELFASRSYLQNILDHVADPIFVKDREHRWIDGNKAFWEIMGRKEHEVRGRTDHDFFSPEEAEIFWQKDEEVFLTGQPNVNTETLTDAAGKVHIISTKKVRFLSPGDEPVLVGIIHDITDITRMEEKLKESDKTRLKSILDHLGSPVYIKDLEGRYLQTNQALLSLLEKEEKDVIGKTDFDLFPEGTAQHFYENDRIVILNSRSIECEESAPHPDGLHTYISVKFPLYDANDALYAICGISTDITPRKKAEEQLQQYTSALERSNKELDDFAYIASHDLKEPLRGLHNHARFLLEDNQDKLDEESVQRLHRLIYLSQRMEKLVNDLLYFSRLGRQELAIRPTDLTLVVQDVESTIDMLLKESNARILIPTPLPTLTVDHTRITEVFRNLIINAIKYNDKPEKTVEIGFLPHYTTTGGIPLQNVLYVKDNGPGIPPEFSEEVFRIFKRLQTKGKKEEGTGAGLTFVKKIIERHGGDIWLESQAGQGTVFYFMLEGKRYDTTQAAA